MPDYAKKKNDELAALCKERGLAHTGKKADLVKRLEEDDTKAPGKAGVEDEIDWDDEPATEAAKAATNEAAANAIAAGGVGKVSNPQAVPNQTSAVDPSQTNDLAVAAAPAAGEIDGTQTEEPKEEKDFSTGVADRTLEEEIQKRKARARKFGMPEDSDEIKALERAQRFGTKDVPGLLNKALSGRGEGKRGSDGELDGGIRKKNRYGPGMKGRQTSSRPSREGSGGGKPAGHPNWMSEKDREAAARRKAKFATAT